MATNAVVIEDLELRSTRRVRLFADGSLPQTTSHFEWIVTSSKYGLGLAILPQSRIACYSLASVHDLPKQAETDPEVTDLPIRVVDYFQENVQISFARLSCNERVLALGVDTSNGPFVHIYDLFAFSPTNNQQPFPLCIIKLGEGRLSCLEWNPESEDVFTVGATDGLLSTIKYSMDNRLNFSIVGQVRMQSAPLCLSWSRKGKQLSVGDAAGRLHQLKPELVVVRVVDAPPEIGQHLATPVQCAGIFWLTTTDWLLAYRQANDPLQLKLSFLSVKKNQPPSWSFLVDLTFQRPNAPQFLDTSFHFLPLMQWNMVFIFAHRSPDFALIGQRNGQWMTLVMDKYNISMPTDTQKRDTYPIGASFDFTSTKNVTLDYGNAESPTLPPQPILHVVSSGGLLLPYNVCSLDQTRPLLQMKPTPFAAQNIMNGPQPTGFQPKPTQGQVPVQTSTFGQAQGQSPAIQPSVPVFSQPQGQSLATQISAPASRPEQSGPSKEALQKAAMEARLKVQQAETARVQENAATLQTAFEQTLAGYSIVKSQLIQEMVGLKAETEMLADKSRDFDTDCVDTLWELFEKVQHSLNDGVHTVDASSRKCANMTASLKQVQNVWQKYEASGEQKRKSIMSSSILEDLLTTNKKLLSVDDRVDQLETKLEDHFKRVLEYDNTPSLLHGNPRPRPQEPIPSTEQMRINKVNDAIIKRVGQFAKKVQALREQVTLLKVHAKENTGSKLKILPDDRELPYWLNEKDRSKTEPTIESLTTEIQRLLLIVDGEGECSPLACNKFRESKYALGELTQRQENLSHFLESRTGKPVQVQHVCPRSLVVDGTLMKNQSIRKARKSELNDQRIERQIAAAKQTIKEGRALGASPRVSAPVEQLSFGTNVDAIAILNAAKSAAIASQPPASVKTSQPSTTTDFSFKNMGQSIVKEAAEKASLAPTEVKASEPSVPGPSTTSSGFTFAPKKNEVPSEQAKSDVPITGQKESEGQKSSAQDLEGPPEAKAQDTKEAPTPSNFSFAPKKEETPSEQKDSGSTSNPTNFSFAPKKDDGLSTAFDNMSGFGQQLTNQEAPKSEKVAFSFTPSKPTTDIEQSTPKSPFSFIPPKSEATSPSSSAPQTSTPINFSFAPKANEPTKTGGFAVGSGFGSNQIQGQSTGFGSGFGSTESKPTGFGSGFGNTENKSAFGQTNQSQGQSTGFGTGNGFTSFPQNKPSTGFGTGFGQSTQPTQQSTGFGTGFGQSTNQPQQQQSGGFSTGFGTGPSFGGSAFGSKPAFGGTPTASGSAFGGIPATGGNAFGSGAATGGSAFGSVGASSGGSGFGSDPSGGGFSAFANKGSSFGQLAQQSQQQSSPFGAAQQQSSFGSGFGGQPTTASPFGSGAAFGGGNSSFGSGSAFGSTQQNKSSAFTAFRK